MELLYTIRVTKWINKIAVCKFNVNEVEIDGCKVRVTVIYEKNGM